MADSPCKQAEAAEAAQAEGDARTAEPLAGGSRANSPFVAFDEATFGYGDGTLVFEGFDLEVPQGQYLCLLGGNGSGKSTLAKLVDALLLPSEGAVRVFGHRTDDESSLFFIRSNTGLVFQSPDDQLVASLVENDVAFGPENLGVPPDKLRQRVESALAEVGLQGFERHEVQGLSGGQKQRVAIAGALALDPALLILDEATAMLDPRGRAALRRVARQLHDQGMTVICITHFMEEAVDADRVVVLDAGRVRMDGTPAEVFAHGPQLQELGLDVPFVVKLTSALRSRIDVAPAMDEAALADQLAARLARGNGMPRNTAATVASDRNADPSLPQAASSARAPEPACEPLRGEAVIRCEGVSYAYGRPSKRSRQEAATQSWGAQPDTAWALRDVTFEVREGGFLGLAGHTGSGKSTLIQMLNGLLKPSAGKVLFRGADLSDKKHAAAARRKVGLVFQYPESQLFAQTVYDDVAFGPRNLGLSPAEVEARVRYGLEAVQLSYDAVYDRSPFALSGGQQRRAALAGVLAMEPEVLVLDEPAAGLDPRGRADLLALLSRLHGQGITMVMASHSMEDLAQLCDYLLVLESGSIARRGTPAQVFADPAALHRLGLAAPAPDAFAATLRSLGFMLPRPLYTVDELAAAIAEELGA